MLGETRLQRFQPPDGAANPVGEGRAIEFDALPGEDDLTTARSVGPLSRHC